MGPHHDSMPCTVMAHGCSSTCASPSRVPASAKRAIVDVVTIYRSVPDPDGQAHLRALAIAGVLDLVTVAAPSAVDALLDAVPAEMARRLPVACIGPVAARAARLAGFPVQVEARVATTDALVQRIIAALRPSG